MNQMANTQVGFIQLDFVNSLRANDTQGGSASNIATMGNYGSIQLMRNRLQAINAAYYTNARLDQMTTNDMVFAIRSIDDRATISDYQPPSTA